MAPRRLGYLPLVTYPDPTPDEAAVQAVEWIATMGFELHATAFGVEIPRISSPIGGMLVNIPDLIREAEERSRKNGLRLAEIVGGAESETGAGPGWYYEHSAPQDVAELAATRARYFDLSVLAWAQGSPTMQALAESVIFGSGRPAVLLPGNAPMKKPSHIAVAWDGSRVAARAVGDALGLVEATTRVSVVTVRDEKPLARDDFADRLVVSLRQRGLSAEAHSISADRRPIAAALQDWTLAAGADLLVMGAYGHSRMRDFVLGGATKGILADLKLPVLLSH